MFGRSTLFSRTGSTLAISLTAFLLLSLFAFSFYILIPVSRQAADDLAALMSLSAQTWVELPPGTRQDFERELLSKHQLRLSQVEAAGSDPLSEDPALYLQFLEIALSDRMRREIRIRSNPGQENWLYVDIPIAERLLRISFNAQRQGTRFSTAALFIVSAGTLVILVTSLLLVKRITRPLSQLSEATRFVGSNKPHPPIPERGPEELADLARLFNRMDREVSELLENRTTLLAGISHDLRTPISRMILALEMIPRAVESDLTEGMRKDLTEMSGLIGQVLQFANGVGDVPRERIELNRFIDELVEKYRKSGTEIDWKSGTPREHQLAVIALQRVLSNLIDNAVAFSDDKGVAVVLEQQPKDTVIRILDRGPGIPEDQIEALFRPFARLESSRSRQTGGSGLGLAITRQLCHANGWSVALSPRDGGGLEARVVLPYGG